MQVVGTVCLGVTLFAYHLDFTGGKLRLKAPGGINWCVLEAAAILAGSSHPW